MIASSAQMGQLRSMDDEQTSKQNGEAGLAATHPHLSKFIPFLDVLNEESARGKALVAASFLENLLLDIIAAYLIPGKSQKQLMVGFNAPIGSLSAKIALAAALGLVSEEERRECDLIRRIRNKFTHNAHAAFDDPDIRDLCSSLAFAAQNYGDVTVPAVGQFSSSVVGLISTLTNRAVYAGRVRLTSRSWQD